MMDGWPFHVETIQQTLNQNLITGQEYTLSFVALKAWHETTPNSSLSVHVRFSDGLLPFQGNSDISNILSAAALLDVGVPPIQVNNGVWTQHSVNFTYNGTQYLDNIIIIPIGQGYGDWLFIDDVSLTMVNPPIFNIPNVLCQNAIYTLPEISQDGFTGAWFPATINTTNLGTSTYTFLPNNPCKSSISITINVINCGSCSSLAWPQLNGTLSGNPNNSSIPVITGNYRVSGNLEIENWVQFQNCVLAIDPNISITVKNNALLELYGSHLYGCDALWNGIVVESEARITTFAPAVNSTLIEDAKIAINLLPTSYIQTNYPNKRVNIYNTIFNKNLTALRLGGYAFSNVNDVIGLGGNLFCQRSITNQPQAWPNISTIVGFNPNYTQGNAENPRINNALFPSSMTLPIKNAAGVNFNSGEHERIGISLLNVGTSNLASNIPFNSLDIYQFNQNTTLNLPNVFDGLNVGVSALRSNVNVTYSVFQRRASNKTISIGVSGTGIYASYDGLIKIDNSLEAHKNMFFNLSMAISVNGYSNLIVKNTQIRTNRSANNVLLGDVGIRFQSARTVQLELKQNQIVNCNRGIHCIIGKHQNYYVNLDISSNKIFRDFTDFTGVTPNHGISVSGLNANEWLTEPTPTSIFRINDNTFMGGRRAIDLQDMTIHRGQVSNNLLALGSTQIFQDIVDGIDFYGVFLRNVKGRTNEVLKNNILGISYQLGDSKAIRVENTPNFTISCNSTNNTRAGIYFFGSCPSRVLNNSMTMHRFGLWLDGAAIIGTQGTNDGQGNPYSPSGNKWIGTGANAWTPFSGIATLNGPERIKTYVSASNANFSKLYVNSGGLTNPIDSWAKDPAASTTPYDNGTRLIPVNYYFPNDPCGANPSGFVNEDELSEDEIDRLLISLEQTTQTAMQPIIENQAEFIKEHAAYDILHKDEDLRDSVTYLHEFYWTKSDENIGALKEIEEKVYLEDYVGAGAIANELMLLNNIDQALKEVLELKLKFEQNNFNSNDSASLHLWATSCYYYFGKAVPMAQTLFNAIFESSTVFIEECSGLISTNSAKQENDFTLDVYPNPNKDILFVESVDKNIKSGHLILYDMLGNSMFDGEISFADGIDLRKILYASGVYLFDITYTSGETVYSEKKRVVFVK